MTHGANIYKYSKIIDCKAEEIIDFSSNINLYQPEIALKLTPQIVAKYPDSNYSKLKDVIAKNYELKHGQIALYNGATAAIYTLLKSLKQKNIYLYAPLYGEYENAALQADKTILKIDRLNVITKEPKKNSIVVFVNPSTPDGLYYNLKNLFKKWTKRNCTIILDESFLEFEELESAREQINEYKKLYIIQSFSKFHSCAGVRIGAIFSSKKNLKLLPTQPWSLSSLDASFLESRLADEEFKTQTRRVHKKQKKQLQNILKESNLFDEILKSDSNFILVHSKKGKEIYKHLLKNKILVRTCGSFDYLSDEWLRFAVKDEASQNLLSETIALYSHKSVALV